MKDMIYKANRTFEILAHGTHMLTEYWVVSMGTHPCAYIDATNFPDGAFNDNREIHGGITYDEDRLQNVWDKAFDDFEPNKKRFIGWDYAHAGDHIEFPSGIPHFMEQSHKWTTEEIVEEVKAVIREELNNLSEDELKRL